MVNVPKDRCMTITADATIDGFTITGGLASGLGDSCRGGAILVLGASPTIRNCVFHTNKSEGCNGGAVYLKESTGASISNCIFMRNQADGAGGAIASYLSTPTITNCTFSKNSAGSGGALLNSHSTTTITNCVLWQDQGGSPSAQEIYSPTGTVTVTYSIVDQEGYAGSNGNLREDPLFFDPSSDNLRLGPGSPAIDAGVCAEFDTYHYIRIAPMADFEGQPRPGYGAITGCDIGADEFLTLMTVNTVEDEVNTDGDCSLREAIIAANTDTAIDACPAGNGFDIVRIPAGLYLLTIPGQKEDSSATGDLDIEDGIALVGEGQGVTVINGGALDRVIDRQKIANMNSLTKSVILSGLTLRNGQVTDATDWPYGGGGVRNWSVLRLEDVELTGNEVIGAVEKGIGGALRGADTGSATTLVRCSIHHNRAPRGAGIFCSGDLEMRNSAVYENTGEMYSALSANRNTVISGSTFSRNENPPTTAVVYVSNMGDYGEQYATLTNVTVSGNIGGGIRSEGKTTINHCTVADNSSYGLTAAAGGYHELTLRNSILANNSPNCGPTYQSVPSAGFNMVSGERCAFSEEGDVLIPDPGLRPLGKYGGFTLTRGLLPRSPAINAADSSDCPATDQRGVPRPFGAGCDIGAFEFSGWSIPWLILLLEE
jgi:CSLREA domain-containing protein